MNAAWRPLVIIWAVLLALLAASVGVTLITGLGPWRQAVSLGIAAIKAVLIGWTFMELRRADPLVRLATTAALVFLTFLFILLAADYRTRGWPT